MRKENRTSIAILKAFKKGANKAIERLEKAKPEDIEKIFAEEIVENQEFEELMNRFQILLDKIKEKNYGNN